MNSSHWQKKVFPRILKLLEFMENNFAVGVALFALLFWCWKLSNSHTSMIHVVIACYFELFNFGF